jgi:hypothetical protein
VDATVFLDKPAKLIQSSSCDDELLLIPFETPGQALLLKKEDASSAQIYELICGRKREVLCVLTFIDDWQARIITRIFHSFPKIGKPLDILIGSGFLDKIRGGGKEVAEKYASGNKVEELVRRLRDEFIVLPGNLVVITTGANDSNAERSFSIIGKNEVLEIPFQLSSSTPIQPSRIVRKSNRQFDGQNMYLFVEGVRFVDSSMHSGRNAETLKMLREKIAGSENSWISQWRNYNEAEKEILSEEFSSLDELHYNQRRLEGDSIQFIIADKCRQAIKSWKTRIGRRDLIIEVEGGRSRLFDIGH